MTIISQETALIEGTLRENIDLRSVDNSKDVEMEAILRRLGFNNQIYMKESLDMGIDGDGANLSAGERQLVSFARTVLEKKPIMILDEATASIDLKTEEVIQNCLETEFKNSTMLIIAHRIQTIMFCDKILILEHGRAVAFESPADLKKNKNGYFMTILDKMKEK
jgi:ABC-type multidrug transport system fused ATPase/permease subunit